jgi:hypothetical protein
MTVYEYQFCLKRVNLLIGFCFRVRCCWVVILQLWTRLETVMLNRAMVSWFGMIQVNFWPLTCFGRIFVVVNGEFVNLLSCWEIISFLSFDTEELSFYWYRNEHAYINFFCNLVSYPVLTKIKYNYFIKILHMLFK